MASLTGSRVPGGMSREITGRSQTLGLATLSNHPGLAKEEEAKL